MLQHNNKTQTDGDFDITGFKIYLSDKLSDQLQKDTIAYTLLKSSFQQLDAVQKNFYLQLLKNKKELSFDDAIHIKTIEAEQTDSDFTPPSFKDMLQLICKNDLIQLNLQKNVQKSLIILNKISEKMQLSNPLLIATFLNKLKLCQHLVENLHLDVNKQTKHEAPPLLYTVLNNSWECFLYLLQQGANINATNKSKQTILFLVARYNNIKFLQQLISHNVDVNQRDSSGRSALYSAAVHGNLSILKTLVQHGGDLYTKDHLGGTLYHAACINGHQNICDYLMSQRIKITTSNNNTDPCDLIMCNTNNTNLYCRMIRYKKKF